MKKFTLPKLNLTKKQIVIISSSVLLLAAIVLVLVLVLKKPNSTKSLAQTIDRSNSAGLELADDSATAKSSTSLQTAYATKDGTKIKVYGETVKKLYDKGNNAIQMTESCQYEGTDKEEETTYTLGTEPVEVNNHCKLTFPVVFDASETVNTLTAYILLPDNSLISVSSNNSSSLQINIYKNETRIVQVTGEAYYRIAPQGNNKIFTVQMMNLIFTATGTEIYTEEGFGTTANSTFGISKGDLTGGFFLYDGSGNLTKRGSNDVIQKMSSSDDTSTYYFSYMKFFAEKIPGVTDALDVLGRGDFLTNQKALSEKYGFGKFKEFTTDKLEAFIYNHISDTQALSVTNVEKKYKEINDEWEALKEKNSSSKNNSSSSSDDTCVSSGAEYQLCSMAVSLGSAHMAGGKCCFDTEVPETTLESTN